MKKESFGRWTVLLICLIIGAAFIGCAGQNRAGKNQPDMESLYGKEWVLEYVNKDKPVIDKLRATIRFEKDGKLTGSGGCNKFFGSYEIKDGKVVIGPVGGTKMMCPPAVMDIEDAYMAALAGELEVRMEEGKMKLCSSEDKCLIFSTD